jgi:twinkle protein
MNVVYINEMMTELIEYTKSGTFRKGFKSGMAELDDLVLFSPGLMAIVTGYPGCGKSEFVDHLCLCWAKTQGYRTLFFSPENHPISEHARKHVERLVGKPIYKIKMGELSEASSFLEDHIAFVNLPEESIPSIELLIKIAEEEMKKRPFHVLVFDPWNECDFFDGQREDLHISRSITKIKKFLRAHNCLGIMVAHPRTPREKVTDQQGRQDYAVPKMSDISGGGIWRAKSDWGIVCHRHPEDNIMRCQFQKVKYKSLGKTGELIFDYEYQTGRFKSQLQPTFSLPWEDEEPPL